MNVLSLFDGMSCGQIALERAGIKVDNYFASEVDKYAIKVTNKNWLFTKQLGDVSTIMAHELPKIDLLIGGSPCQGFSFAGKQLNFDDERSKLFFEYVRLKKECRPKYWLMDNVPMKKEYQKIISELLGCGPIQINSALVSAQNRKRLYWTNIPNVTQPEDKGIFIQDILDGGIIGRNVNRRYKNGHRADYDESIPRKAYFEPREDLKSGTLTTVPKDNVLCKMVGTTYLKAQNVRKRVYSVLGKSPTLYTASGGYHAAKIAMSEIEWRYLTPREYERLQTVPDGYTSSVSDSQAYNMLGNGWTIDVIAHIFKGIKGES